MTKIGVLALQGDISEHRLVLEGSLADMGLDWDVVEVRDPLDLRGLSGLVIPGGESTTISKLLKKTGLDNAIKDLAKTGFPILGTCAGLVLMASSGCEGVARSGQSLLGLMDIKVERNAFGRQRESFEAGIHIPALGPDSYHAVYIRAPCVTRAGSGVEVLAEFEGRIVAAREGNMVVLAFHPELSDDLRMHKYFLEICKSRDERS